MSGYMRTPDRGGQATFESTLQFTRPANVTAYAVGDVISDSVSAPTAFAIPDVGSEVGQSVLITKLTVHLSTKAATALACRVWLFNAAPTVANDNSPLTLTDAENRACPTRISPIIGGSATNNFMLETQDVSELFKLGAALKSIPFLLEARNAYTPASAEIFDITIRGLLF